MTINISSDFSTEPYGRYPSDGDTNGTRFRKEFLAVGLNEAEQVTIILDGTEGYGSSFLDEAFGGLVRLNGFQPADLHRRIQLVSMEDPTLISEIWEYIDSAKPKSGS